MEQIVTITTQGQLTLPKIILNAFGIKGATKALVKKIGDSIVVKPKGNFWSLAGSMKSDVSLSDKELRQARDAFSKQWPRKI